MYFPQNKSKYNDTFIHKEMQMIKTVNNIYTLSKTGQMNLITMNTENDRNQLDIINNHTNK